jgi:phosphohistidine phosphatase SixA
MTCDEKVLGNANSASDNAIATGKDISVKMRIARFYVFLMLVSVCYAQGQEVRTIFFVRHADKISDAPDSLLSEAGHRRAECLAKMLADVDIQRIYTSDLQRTQQTAAPLAQQRKLKPVAIPLSKPDELIEALQSEKSAHVLVVWHGGTLPRILHALGGPEVPPIDEAEYDRLFILTRADNNQHSALSFTVLRYCDRAE